MLRVEKGHHLLHLYGADYQWRAEPVGAGLRVVVESAQVPGATLVLRLREAGVPSTDQLCRAIEWAQAQGWSATEPGPPFQMSLRKRGPSRD
jgi:hypothetical protein